MVDRPYPSSYDESIRDDEGRQFVRLVYTGSAQRPYLATIGAYSTEKIELTIGRIDNLIEALEKAKPAAALIEVSRMDDQIRTRETDLATAQQKAAKMIADAQARVDESKALHAALMDRVGLFIPSSETAA